MAVSSVRGLCMTARYMRAVPSAKLACWAGASVGQKPELYSRPERVTESTNVKPSAAPARVP
eukprot:9478476-Pyramimonas_sp.AAC.1